MDIEVPIRCFGQVAMQDLATAILAQDEAAWNENTQRQQDYEVHEQTRSIVLLFADVEAWPEARLAASRVGIVSVRSRNRSCRHPRAGTTRRVAGSSAPWPPKLLAGGRILPHRDSHPSFAAGHRIHVPTTTNPRVRFMIDGRPCRMEIGQAYEINNQKMHSVMNGGTEDRITFIFDYLLLA